VVVVQRVMRLVFLDAVTALPPHVMLAAKAGSLTALVCSARLAKVLP